jgi:hypothetical protein
MNSKQADLLYVADAVIDSLHEHASKDAKIEKNARSPVAVIKGTVTTLTGRAIAYRLVITDADVKP